MADGEFTDATDVVLAGRFAAHLMDRIADEYDQVALTVAVQEALDQAGLALRPLPTVPPLGATKSEDSDG